MSRFASEQSASRRNFKKVLRASKLDPPGFLCPLMFPRFIIWGAGRKKALEKIFYSSPAGPRTTIIGPTNGGIFVGLGQVEAYRGHSGGGRVECRFESRGWDRRGTADDTRSQPPRPLRQQCYRI